MSAASTPTPMGGRERVAILGGGIGALAAAWELAKNPRYEITIYQLGWRLGGKLATGRNADAGMRIEEHGIHGFMGAYYNAGVMMEEVYATLAALGDDAKYFYSSFDAAFVRQDSAVMWESIADQWTPWMMSMPRNKLSYGNMRGIGTAEHSVAGLLRMLGVHLDIALTNNTEAQGLAKLLQEVIAIIEDGKWASAGDKMVGLVDSVWAHVRPLLEKIDQAPEIRHALITVDFLVTVVKGFFADSIATRGYQSIDDEDYSAWLKRHGASAITLKSPFALNAPDITYNFPNGDMTLGPRMSAGAYVQWNLRLFGYVGAFVLAFRAGSGETILAPLYRALVAKGVHIEFFNKVDALHLSADKTSIAAVDISIQATTKNGALYQPLFGPVGQLLCWPNQPNYDQLEQGSALREQKIDLESWWTPWQTVGSRTLKSGSDYAHLVLGISLGALPFLCRELIADDSKPPLVPGTGYASRWAALVAEVKTVQTQAMQLWFKAPIKTFLDSRVQLPPDNEWIAGTYVLPISGQADFSNLISMESWGDAGPRGLFYLCGPMSDSGIPPFDQVNFPALQRERVRAQSIQYLQATAGPMLPGATTQLAQTPTTPGSLDFSLLYVPPPQDANAEGTQRFDAQFWRANIDPTERYVTCMPGTAKFRLGANGSGYTNLFLCGDWIDTGLNVGSVEGAVMGGKLASNAISELPALNDIWGYDPFGLRHGTS